MFDKLAESNLKEANKRQENNKILFNQGVWEAVKLVVQKLVKDGLSLLEQRRINEDEDALESKRIRSKDSADNLFLAILEQIKQKMSEYVANQLKAHSSTSEKLDNLVKQVSHSSNVKAEFAVHEPAIIEEVGAIRVDLENIERELEPGSATPQIGSPEFVALEGRATNLRTRFDSAVSTIDGWLNKFNEAAEATQKSLQEVVNSIPETTTQSEKKAAVELKEVNSIHLDAFMEWIDSIAKTDTKADSEIFLSAMNINFDVEKDRLEKYKKELDSMGLRITAVESKITSMRPTDMYRFMRPQPSFSNKRNKKVEEDESVMGRLFTPSPLPYKPGRTS